MCKQQSSFPDSENQLYRVEAVDADADPPERVRDQLFRIDLLAGENRQQVEGHAHDQQDDATDQVHVSMGKGVYHVSGAAEGAADRVEPGAYRRHDLQHAVHGADKQRKSGKQKELQKVAIRRVLSHGNMNVQLRKRRAVRSGC